MICDINRISHENFSSTVFNFEEEMELKNKITKFNEFNYTQIPKNRPIISDLVENLSSLILFELFWFFTRYFIIYKKKFIL